MPQEYQSVVLWKGETWDAEVVRRRRKKQRKTVEAKSGFQCKEEAHLLADGVLSDLLRQKAEQMAAQAMNAEKQEALARSRLEDLARELQAIHQDVDVRDGIAHGNGMFSLKIETPVCFRRNA